MTCISRAYKRVAILHINTNPLGGAERVCMAICKVFKELGYKVSLITLVRPQHSTIYQFFDEVRWMTSSDVNILNTIKASIFEYYVRIALDKQRYSLTVNTSPLSSPLLVGNVLYIHFPYYFVETILSANIIRRIYGISIDKTMELLKSAMPKHGAESKLFLFNSYYTYGITRKLLGVVEHRHHISLKLNKNSFVIYPPIDVEKYLNYNLRFVAKEPRVITIARIAPDKNLETIVEIAKLIKDKIKFIIVGRVEDPKYLAKLIRIIRKNGLETKIKILANVNEEAKVKLLISSAIYLHTKIREHFGIAIVEAMAAGTIPLAHNSGGVREILPHDFLYNSPEEAAHLIEKYLNITDIQRRKIAFFLRSKASDFTYEKFKQRIISLLKDVLRF